MNLQSLALKDGSMKGLGASVHLEIKSISTVHTQSIHQSGKSCIPLIHHYHSTLANNSMSHLLIKEVNLLATYA